jgi:hypothetical protein
MWTERQICRELLLTRNNVHTIGRAISDANNSDKTAIPSARFHERPRKEAGIGFGVPLSASKTDNRTTRKAPLLVSNIQRATVMDHIEAVQVIGEVARSTGLDFNACDVLPIAHHHAQAVWSAGECPGLGKQAGAAAADDGAGSQRQCASGSVNSDAKRLHAIHAKVRDEQNSIDGTHVGGLQKLTGLCTGHA